MALLCASYFYQVQYSYDLLFKSYGTFLVSAFVTCDLVLLTSKLLWKLQVTWATVSLILV